MFCFGLGSAFGESRNERNFTRAKALVQGIGPTLAATVNLFMCVRSARNWELFSFLRKPVERWMCALRTWAFTWNEWFDLRYGPTSVIRARLHTILAILLNKNERTEDLCAQEFNRDKNLTQFFYFRWASMHTTTAIARRKFRETRVRHAIQFQSPSKRLSTDSQSPEGKNTHILIAVFGVECRPCRGRKSLN